MNNNSIGVIIIYVVFLAVLILPTMLSNNKKKKQKAALLESLKVGDKITIVDSLVLEFSSKNANLTQSIVRKEIEKEVTLKKGVYTCGKDFEIGIYDIVLVEDGGSIEIETEGVGNFANSYIFGPDYKDIKEIRNYDFEIGEKIHIYGKNLVIKLSPSKNNWLFGK